MVRALALILCLAPSGAFAQANDVHSMTHGKPMAAHERHMAGEPPTADRVPTQPGQSAFAAIQEIVAILEADPKTDWSKVDIDALREHLVDMNNVTLAANVKSDFRDGGVRFDVTGVGPVSDSIRRMVEAHAATMNGVDGWTFEAREIDGGASLLVHAPQRDANKLRGLGFFGVLTIGMHHQMHHVMIARGEKPHG